METMPLVIMGLMGLAAGWIANQLLSGGKGDLVQMLLTGVVGAFVGGHIQRFVKLDVARLGNPLLEELAVHRRADSNPWHGMSMPWTCHSMRSESDSCTWQDFARTSFCPRKEFESRERSDQPRCVRLPATCSTAVRQLRPTPSGDGSVCVRATQRRGTSEGGSGARAHRVIAQLPDASWSAVILSVGAPGIE